jgi:ubiquinone/menaquinone biosynthesis C-methylase UbiE
MQPVNYDAIAPGYDRRYQRNRYDGVRAVLRQFVDEAHDAAVAEVGCGTGHWLTELSDGGFHPLFGLDLSAGMLRRAQAAAPTARLVRSSASQLPWSDNCLDRVFCVNALHHFPDQQAFIAECRRVLRPGGGLLTIGLDPHQGGDQWWVYDFFPAARDADRLRYPSAARIREWLTASGFREPATEAAQHLPREIAFESARQQGFLDRHATSQFMVIGDDDYEAGMARLLAEQPMLRADLRLYATTAWT